jgi:hypothetical protein
MNVFLMARNGDFRLPDHLQPGRELIPSNRPRPQSEDKAAAALVQDLALPVLYRAMGQGDTFLEAVALAALLEGVHGDIETILYRQAILRDCMANPAVVRELYAIAVAALQSEQKVHFGYFSKSPDMVLRRAVEVLQLFVAHLRQLRILADEHAPSFRSPGFCTLFGALQHELDDDYLGSVRTQLDALAGQDELTISAGLGKGNKGSDYRLCRAAEKRGAWPQRVFGPQSPVLSFTVAERDLNGAQALVTLRNQGLNSLANALAQAGDHIQAFFSQLRTELAFYLGCLNLQQQLAAIGAKTCFPTPADPAKLRLGGCGLYDVCLALTVGHAVVANDLAADSDRLVLITGANQGGKSTFLRSVGLAQLMMQGGMPVAAETFCASVTAGVFTHFRREEDARMDSGKLDEELSRMSAIVDKLRPGALLLCNESFAATNEREGAALAREIVLGLIEQRVRVVFVTHLYTLAGGLYDEGRAGICFLRAERRPDGARTFRIEPGLPQPTSFGADLYARIIAP